MTITVTDYLDVISSWCFWSEPTWAELKRRYDGRVQFQWKIALMDPTGLPTSRQQEQWFYRRSGMMMRSAFMLSTEWYDPNLPEWLAPNCVAEAAKDFGFTDDRVRLALARATLREGKNIADWNIAAEIGAEAAGIEVGKLLERAKSQAIEKRVRASTAEFRALTDHATTRIRDRYRDRGPRYFFWSGQTRAIGSNNRFNARGCGCVRGAQSALWRPAGKVISGR